MKRLKVWGTILTTVVGIGGCDKVKEGMGLERQVPDAFAVVALPPLSLPPEFNLRPPSSFPSGEGEGEVIGALDAQVEEQAVAIEVFGTSPLQSQKLDSGEQVFLDLVQEHSIPASIRVSNIRETLKEEANLSSTPTSLKDFVNKLKKSFKKDPSLLDAHQAYQEIKGETVNTASVRGILSGRKEG